MKNKVDFFIRFSLFQRAEHLLVLSLFVILVVTGLPQKFYDTAWAEWIILSLGGIGVTRFIHRIIGIVFSFVAFGHIFLDVAKFMLGKVRPEIIPTKKDFRDAIVNIKHYLGLTAEKPQFDRYDYRQKFEYWGMVLGGMVMITTGFMLYFPILFTIYMPGEFIAAAKVAHSNEAMLALLVIVVWHLYHVILKPEFFPLDTAIFTGKISHERMIEEHPLEYERIMGGDKA